jgi:hypothetical protein
LTVDSECGGFAIGAILSCRERNKGSVLVNELSAPLA